MTISVIDVNDNSPVFSLNMYSFVVPENAPASTPVGVIQVTDRDFGSAANVVLSLTGINSDR